MFTIIIHVMVAYLFIPACASQLAFMSVVMKARASSENYFPTPTGTGGMCWLFAIVLCDIVAYILPHVNIT